jgi:S-DNA-T family DNA segregation ATPase FtsK/SpoIIIE
VRKIATHKEQKEQQQKVKERKEAIAKNIEKEKTRTPPKIKPMPKQLPKPSERFERERQQPLFDAPVTGTLPPLGLLDPANEDHKKGFSMEALEAMSRLLEHKLKTLALLQKWSKCYPARS